MDCLFPTLRDSPHQAKMEVSVAAMQKRLKEAFTVARHLTSQEAARQRRYYGRKAGACCLTGWRRCHVSYRWLCGQEKDKGLVEDGVLLLSPSWRTGLFIRLDV